MPPDGGLKENVEELRGFGEFSQPHQGADVPPLVRRVRFPSGGIPSRARLAEVALKGVPQDVGGERIELAPGSSPMLVDVASKSARSAEPGM